MQRKKHSPEFKAKIALEALKEQKTINETASQSGVHATQINNWKKQAREGLKEIFSQQIDKNSNNQESLISQLYEHIGRLEVELDWLKKNLDSTIEEKRKLIEPSHPQIDIERQCELIGLNRSSYYYQPRRENDYNESLMRKLDELYTKEPLYGVRRMTAVLRREGENVNVKRIRRLLRLMRLEATYPKPNTSKGSTDNVRRYPYLLTGLNIEKINQVYSTDINYIRLAKGFVYLVAVMDWYSRYVLSWRVSNSLDVSFCIEALEESFKYGHPCIFNTDQGSQFTSLSFTSVLLERKIKISQDGKGRAFDNIFIERLWRSLKYEEVYLKSYDSVAEAIEGIGNFFERYNYQRPHQSLNYSTPAQIHFD
jgi:putative transposase